MDRVATTAAFLCFRMDFSFVTTGWIYEISFNQIQEPIIQRFD